MRQTDIVYCEMCGRPVRRRDARIVYIEGARLVLCPECYRKVVKKDVAQSVRSLTAKPPRPATSHTARTPAPRPQRPRRRALENLEVVQEYAERIRKARERLGWSQRVLAEAVGEGENVIKRMEAGRLTPSIDQARKLEKVLNIKLLEPVVDEGGVPALFGGGKVSKELTLGDIAAIRKKKEGQ
ncbi:MAG: TIGR00270 family protein [Desulfurococcales archaeon]|nr:TIGR00270 family protein [Desulfurococcales archaeon]